MTSYSSLERSLRFFASVFRPSSTPAGGGGAGRRPSSILAVANGGAVQDAASTSSKQQQPQAHGPGSGSGSGSAGALKSAGFRLVDMERFVESLSTHAWLANGSRKKHTAVCLFHRVQREGVGTASGGGGGGGGREPAADEGAERDADEQQRQNMQARMAAIDRKIKASEPEDTVRIYEGTNAGAAAATLLFGCGWCSWSLFAACLLSLISLLPEAVSWPVLHCE